MGAEPASSFAERSTQAMTLDRGRTTAEARTLTGIARQATRGADQAFPHSSRIAAGFGRYAPQGLRALVGGAAAIAGDALNADAFMLGNRAGFARAPNLRLAAHEAAHAVAQAHGAAPTGGVGAPGDRGERLADAVADRVASGGSAESLFARELRHSDTAAPQIALQMYNRLDVSKTVAPAHETPWKEISDQLGIKLSDVVSKMTQANPAFGTMNTALGTHCVRAEEVEAEIDGIRKGGPRGGDPMQTAFGTLGTFMEYITGTPQATSINSYFEGGHLISDEVLGDDSYVHQNFAPQRRQINSPAYRKIEEIAAGHVVNNAGTHKPKPKRKMKVKLSYLAKPVKITSAAVLTRLGNPAATKTPTDVNLTQRVPWKWHAEIDTTDSDFVWAYETSVDSAATSGAALGWRAKESDAETVGADAETYIDATAWAMDTMDKAVPGSNLTSFGTGGLSGMADQRQRKHTFTGVQAVPMGQTTTHYGGFAPVVAPPVAPPSYTLKKAPSFSDLQAATLIGGDGKVLKRRKDMAKEILDNNPTWKQNKTDVEAALARIEFAKLLKKQGGSPSLDDEFKKFVTTGGKKDKKRKRAEVGDVIFNQLTNSSSTNPFL